MLLIDQYAYINHLAKTHPVEKIVLSLFLLIFSLTVKDALISLITFSMMSGLIIFAAKIPWKYYLKLLCIPGLFLLSSMVGILFSFTQHAELLYSSVWQISFLNGTVYITTQSIQMCIQLFFSVLSSIGCLYFLTLTTPVHDLMQVLKKCRVPQLMIELTELTYRFIFVFLEISVSVFQAQNSRLGYISIKRGFHSLGMLISSLFVHVFHRSKELLIAMDSRGYHESVNFLEDSYHYSKRNWTLISFIFVLIIGVYIEFGGILV